MSRTPGSGWGNGMIRLFQVCPFCKKKKVLYVAYKTYVGEKDFHCTFCKENFNDDVLLKISYAGKQESKKG